VFKSHDVLLEALLEGGKCSWGGGLLRLLQLAVQYFKFRRSFSISK